MFDQRERGLRRSDGKGLPVQSIFEDGLYVFIGIGFHCQSSGAGRFETLGSKTFP
jgi:hypothetical protein